MNSQVFSQRPMRATGLTPIKQLGAMVFVTILLLMALLWGLEHWTAQAEQLQKPSSPEFTIVKTASQGSAARGAILTFTIDVHNVDVESVNVEGTDMLPAEMVSPSLVMYDERIITPEVLTDRITFTVIGLGPGGGARLVYQARIKPDAECGKELVNRAWLTFDGERIGEPVETHVVVLCSDLGDAPASENHFSVDMLTVSGLRANYPTVYDPPSGAPSGPLHRRADLMHLGEMVSFERQADIGADGDPTNNILPPFNAPDRDGFDDGLMNLSELNLAHCEPATLQLLVYMDPTIVDELDRAFINVWFDGNRDGDWDDVNICEGLDMPKVPEHIVIDFPVSPSAGFQTVSVNTTVPVFNLSKLGPTWLRVTLSEQLSVKIGDVDSLKYGDGRGVFSTLLNADTGESVAGFKLGETEDYFFRPPSLEPGLIIRKIAEPSQANFGDEVTFEVGVDNAHTSAQSVVILDPIPPGMTYISGTFGSSLEGLASGYDVSSNSVFWRGEVPAQGAVGIAFRARVTRCELQGFVVENRAWALARGYPPVEAKASVYVGECVPPPRRIKVEKSASQYAAPGGDVKFTLTARNFDAETAVSLTVVDPLPSGLGVDPASLPQGVELASPNTIIWPTSIKGNSAVSITFTADVYKWVCRERRLVNQAHWQSDTGLEGYSNPVWIETICSDLGDAPDSTLNHHGITNTAYFSPSVAGRYPTVWEATFYPPGEPSGPLHFDATKAWLGDKVSHEKQADIGPDADGPNNILDSGLDVADDDQLDDGWLNPRVPLPDCEEATLKVRIFKNHAAMKKMWLNVWFDGNRDGDWEDWKFCGDDNQRRAFEWIVQNFVVDMSAWPVNTYRDVVVRTALVMNDYPDEVVWTRFTLSESPPPRHPTTGLADGRGPDYERHYRWGETEDYLAPGAPVGEPGQVIIKKGDSVADAVAVGQVYTYSVYLDHSGGSGPAHVVMTDVLPAEVKLAGGPTVTELAPSASPLVAYFDSHVGPNGAVGWRGLLSSGAAIRVDFPVEVVYCPNDEVRVIYNKAVATQLGATSVLSAVVETPLKCDPSPEPNIELRKRIVTALGEEATDWTAVSGTPIVYALLLSGDNKVTHTVHISDPMQSGVIAFAADAFSGEAHVIQNGRAVIWKGELGPAINKVLIRIRARLREVDCDTVVKNTAYWYTRFHHGKSNTTQLTLACYDLGDAPDSSNHFPATMTAYPGVTATFPTVYTGTTPLMPIGPLHLRPLPLHLGPRVSLEFEADYGMDMDGVNNIKPKRDKADLDKADDGLELDKLQFTHCESQRIPVLISIDPSVLPPTGQEVFAYINIWLDSNRDGDWNDAFDCPTATGGQSVLAPEHIVIDYPVSLSALGPGLHHIFVTTTGPVPWPSESTGPAWLRITLSERKSNKTLPAGCAADDCSYGDGRGHETPFALGETEDYLLREPDQPDLAIEKHGSIYPFFGLASQAGDESRVWNVNWSAHYKNIGGMAVTDVEVIDTLSSGQKLVKVHSFPPVTRTIHGATLTFTVGTLVPGKTGHVFIRTSVPLTTAPGTVLTNTITITGHSDSDFSNNSQAVTVTVPLLPPVIAYPRPGTLCSGLFTITGRVQPPGAIVEVFINSVSVTTVTADALGRWLHPVNLPDGNYAIQARARYGSLTSLPSPPVLVTVDSSMAWSPLSLRFVSEYGHVAIPKDADGNADEDSWTVFLRPGLTYTVTVFSCCDDPNASVTLELPDGQVIHLEDSDGDGWYVGTFTVPEATSPMSGSIRLCVTCYNIRYCSDGEVLIDPEGVVFDVIAGQASGLLEEAVVACYEGQTDMGSGETFYSSWDAASYGGQVNPQTTAADGYFSFFTPAGVYQLDVFKENYQPYRSWDLVVVSELVEFNVPLTPDTTEEADSAISINESGFDPPVLTVEPGAIVEWTNIGDAPHTATSITPTARIEGVGLLDLSNTDGWDSGLLGSGETYKRQLNTVGSYYYYDHENPAYTGLIVVEEAVEEKYPIYLPLVLRNG
jgi:uncharacterized repeat protein (TIGR01451 family)